MAPSRPFQSVLMLAFVVALPACHREAPPVVRVPRASSLGDEIPSAVLDAVLAAHLQGLGHMERYEYDKAADAFREVHGLAPGWMAGSINLAIALLNQTGSEGDRRRAWLVATASDSRKRLRCSTRCLSATRRIFPRTTAVGSSSRSSGSSTRAQRDFLFVAEHDPRDAHAWYKVGSTLTDPERPDRPAGPKQAGRLIEVYSKALELNPNLVSALYKLQAAYGWAGQRDRQKELIRRWQELDPRTNPAGPGEPAGTTYGEMGRYAQHHQPGWHAPRAVAEPVRGAAVLAAAGADRDRLAGGLSMGQGFRLRRSPGHHRPGARPLRRSGGRVRRRRRRQARPLPLRGRDRATRSPRRPL